MDFAASCKAIIGSAGQEPVAQRLHRLFDLVWENAMEEFPEAATYYGHPGCDDRWTDRSREGIDRRRASAGLPLEVLASIERSELDDADQLSYDLLEYDTRRDVDATAFPGELLAITQMDGIQQEAATVLGATPAEDANGVGNVLARLRALPDLIAQTKDLLEEGVKNGVTPPQVTLRDLGAQVRACASIDPTVNPFLAELKGEAKRQAAPVVLDTVAPAFAAFADWIEATYVPGARQSTAATELPDGDAWYAQLIRQSTTTDLTAAQIHEIGLAEVARIRSEMEAIKAEAGFDGDLRAFFDYLRTDAQFFFTDAESLLTAYRDICKRIDPELCRLFGVLPRLPYGVLPVPAHIERSQTTAYYMPGAPEAHRPGYYFANTYDLPSRPRWEMEALTLHEAVPGHHLQIALAQELEDVPRFRRGWSAYTAFVEGWALYAESLGPDLGLYQDPLSRFGQLTYEMWRAIRLVVDTGMHALGWSRQRAIDFFTDNAGKAEHDIVVEIDRYLVWPGQALAYKLGELKIKELRALAEAQAGERFDVRSFHDFVLGSGALPLEVLDKRVRDRATAGFVAPGRNPDAGRERMAD
ncbi:MAG TPA: DUF885 domain-containing protein [Acidimicrobiales bacterium]|nr:DUF885 domain-containing protein [Acidimicrobiales bacterium]